MKKNILMICILLSLAGYSYAQPGALDNTFSSDGKVITAIGSNDEYGKALAVQSDGKIVVAGYSAGSAGYDFALLRYNSDGSLDNSFGTGGIVLTDLGSSADEAYSVLLQPDGKILAAGKGSATFTDDPTTYDFALVRYNSDGSLDNTFGTGGKVLTDIGMLSSDRCYSAVLQNDGKIVLAGYSGNASSSDFALVRYSSTGSLDPAFGTGGIVLTDFGGTRDESHSVAIQGDGKIVAAGFSENASAYDMALARYNTDGTSDNSFDTDGKLLTDFGSPYDYALSVVIQNDGKIVAGGYTNYSASSYDFALARYNSNGSPDNSFDSDGKLTTDLAAGSSDMAAALAIQNDGKILAAGRSSSTATGFDFALLRYNIDGSPDNTFDSDGIVTTDFPGPNNGDYANAIALQSDGKIVLAGEKGQNLSSTSFVWDIAVARYNVNAASTAGITESSAMSGWNVQLYPNPSDGKIRVICDRSSLMSVEVYDPVGQKVFSGITENREMTVDLSAQPKGIYFIKLSSGERQVTRMLVLE
jgi:uncharacterized delta-60 repeat protein